MRALVTGAAGFIGSTPVDRVLADGRDVVGIDNLGTGAVANLEYAVRRNTVNPRRCTFVEARSNVLGTINLREASRRSGVQRNVCAASGGSRYGAPACLPISESAPVDPLSPYAATKVAGEPYLSAHARMFDIAPISLALADVYAPRQCPHGEAGARGEPTWCQGKRPQTPPLPPGEQDGASPSLWRWPAGTPMRSKNTTQ
jgi:UDP-glucose 4-epimerase